MDHPHPQSSKSFGELLRVLRQRAHLTQRELAVIVGYSDAQINRYEKGLRAPDPSVVEALFIKALGLEPESDLAIRLVALARKPAQIAVDSATTDANSDQHLHPRLPLPTTDLFGRDADIQAVLEMLSRNNVRILTLVGPPGVGKTRLAIQLAVQIESQFQHGAIFVALASITDSSLLGDALLQAMGVTSTTKDPLMQLKNVLHKRNMLLVLDNFEHLLGFSSPNIAANIVAELVTTAPHIKVLVTSRTSLRLSGEHVYEAPSLAPAAARALFVSRATALNPTFKPRSSDDQAIAGICLRLDHLPLAIELAAARIRLFEPPALLKKLAAPLAFLTTGSHDLPHRQRTLKTAISWSYDLLAPEEQILFRRLSIFADGCTMDMIEAIAGSDLTSSVMDIVQSLVDKSMLKSEPVNGTMRFRLLEMLCEYAWELLANTAEAETIAQRSAQWFVDQVQTMQNDPATSETAAWFEWFDAEVSNVHAVIQWSMQSNHIEYGLQLASKLGVTWRLHGPAHSGFQLTSQLLAHPHAREDVYLYAQVLLSYTHVAEKVGEADLSENSIIEALGIFRQMGDRRLAARAMAHLGDHAITRGESATARLLIEESIAIAREVGDRRGLTLALNWLGTIERDQGNFQQALAICAEAIKIAHEIRSVSMSFMATGWTSFVYQAMGDYDRAKGFAEQSLQICVENRLTGSANIMRGSLGSIALFQGDIDCAILQLDSAREGQELHGDPDMRASTLISLGFAYHLKGDSAKGEAMLREAIEVHWKCQRMSAIPDSLSCLAWIAVDRRELPHAVRLMGAAAALNTQLSVSSPAGNLLFSEPRLQAAKSGLSQTDFELFWREGQAMDCKAAVDYVLG